MGSNGILHVAIAPPIMVEADLIKGVAAIINRDLHATQILLAGKIPRIIAHYQTAQAAESVAQHLRSLGLVVMVCKDSELRQTFPSIFKACDVRFGQGEFVFEDRGATAKLIRTENVFLILKGIMQIQTEKEITKTRMELNLLATLITGGMPIRRKVEEKTREKSFRNEYFIRLYHRKSLEPDIEITQHNFDYSCLGANMSATALTNLNTLFAKIKELCPQSVCDDSLAESLRPNASLNLAHGNNDIRCKLIYLFHEAISASDSSA